MLVKRAGFTFTLCVSVFLMNFCSWLLTLYLVIEVFDQAGRCFPISWQQISPCYLLADKIQLNNLGGQALLDIDLVLLHIDAVQCHRHIWAALQARNGGRRRRRRGADHVVGHNHCGGPNNCSCAWRQYCGGGRHNDLLCGSCCHNLLLLLRLLLHSHRRRRRRLLYDDVLCDGGRVSRCSSSSCRLCSSQGCGLLLLHLLKLFDCHGCCCRRRLRLQDDLLCLLLRLLLYDV